VKNSEVLPVDLETGAVTALVYERQGPPVGASLILAHGAGAGQRSPFLVEFAQALADRGLDVITFNFPYTEHGRKVPDRRPVLDACYKAVIDLVSRSIPSARDGLFIGGKSMGGRIATHVAAADPQTPVRGLVLLGYPLHPPGKPLERRDAHLPDLRRPALIIQGSRDTFGTPPEFDEIVGRMSPRPTLHVVDGGDHSFKVVPGGKKIQADLHARLQDIIVAWIQSVLSGRDMIA
jgi:predicted alpha/beta-hydrolase family hydrolase